MKKATMSPKLNMVRLKGKLKIAAREVTATSLKALYVLPIRKNRIVFEAFQGRSYACNPKYLCDYIHTHYPGQFELIWGFRDPDTVGEDFPYKKVRYGSFAWIKTCLTAKVIVTNWKTLSYIPKRKNQLVINTWHAGGAYKRVGLEVSFEDPLQDWLHGTFPSRAYSLYLTSSRLFTRYNIKEAYHYTGKILKSGMPRNDVLMDADRRSKIAAEVRSELGIGRDEALILYAPTFRGSVNGSDALSYMIPARETIAAAEKRFGKKARLLIRTHYLDQSRYTFSEDMINMSAYPDMQRLLCAADVLITDYSSSMWDFALTGKPCLLFVPDLDTYEKDDKGFFIPISEWPGIVCRTGEALCDTIESLDETVCAANAARHLQAAESCEEGRASELVTQEIVRYIKTGKV